MRASRLKGAAKEASSTTALAAADDARIHHRALARVALVVGIILVAGSMMLWPRGLFRLGTNPTAVWVVLIVSGVLLLLVGTFAIVWSVRRVSRLQHNYNSVGKPDAGFVFQPDIGLPQIGQGHGGPTDASAALFANPDKVNNGRR